MKKLWYGNTELRSWQEKKRKKENTTIHQVAKRTDSMNEEWWDVQQHTQPYEIVGIREILYSVFRRSASRRSSTQSNCFVRFVKLYCREHPIAVQFFFPKRLFSFSTSFSTTQFATWAAWKCKIKQ